VEAAATSIPDSITVSLAGLDVGATITSADLTLPPEVDLAGVGEEPFPIASITAPVAEEPEEEPDTEAAAGETGAGEAGSEDGEPAEGS